VTFFTDFDFIAESIPPGIKGVMCNECRLGEATLRTLQPLAREGVKILTEIDFSEMDFFS